MIIEKYQLETNLYKFLEEYKFYNFQIEEEKEINIFLLNYLENHLNYKKEINLFISLTNYLIEHWEINVYHKLFSIIEKNNKKIDFLNRIALTLKDSFKRNWIKNKEIYYKNLENFSFRIINFLDIKDWNILDIKNKYWIRYHLTDFLKLLIINWKKLEYPNSKKIKPIL